MLFGAGLPLASIRIRLWRAVFPPLVLAALFTVATQLAFDSGTIIAFTYPLLALVLAIVATLTIVLLGEAFERQHARDIFARFVPPDVVDEVLARTDDDFRLGGVERDCTVLFSDLRGFTSFWRDAARGEGDRGRQLLPQRDDRGDPRRGGHADRLHG